MAAIHLCIDMQNVEREEYKSDGVTSLEWVRLESNINHLTNVLNGLDVPTICIAFDPLLTPMKDGVGYFKDTPLENLKIFCQYNLNFTLPITPRTLVAYKRYQSACRESSIVDWVRERDISEIILSGVTEMNKEGKIDGHCVSETARCFSRAGYEVTIVKEATNCEFVGGNHHVFLNQRRRNHRKFGVKVAPMEDILLDQEMKFFCPKKSGPIFSKHIQGPKRVRTCVPGEQ